MLRDAHQDGEEPHGGIADCPDDEVEGTATGLGDHVEGVQLDSVGGEEEDPGAPQAHALAVHLRHTTLLHGDGEDGDAASTATVSSVVNVDAVVCSLILGSDCGLP